MKVFKFFKVALVTGALAAMMVVPAFASKKYYDFDLYTSEGGDAHSAVNYKDDDEQTAYIYTTDGNIASSDNVQVHLIGATNETRYSSDKRFDSNSKRYLFPYTRYASSGTGIRFYIKTFNYDVKVSGYWYS